LHLSRVQAFNSLLEVYNFPLKDRPREELQELEVLKARRRIEIAELTVNIGRCIAKTQQL
jgi:hypothetical protein